jgi:hypothetical protein
MIASLTARRLSVPPATKKITLPPIAEPMAVVKALEQHFNTKPSLSAEEFVGIITANQPQ